MTMADRIAVMDRGRLVQVAAPPEIYERPASRFVTGFIGDVNLFEGRVAGGEAGLWSVAVAALPVAVAVFGPEHRLSPGQDVCVAVRPEKIAIHRAPPSEQPNAFAGTVSDIGYLGDWSVYRVRLASGTVVTAAQPNATRFVEGGIRAGEPLVLSFAPEAALLLTR